MKQITPQTSARISQFFYRFGGLVIFSLSGIFLFAFTLNIMVMTGLLSADEQGAGYGEALARQAVMVWMGATMIGFISLFVQANWRWPFYLAPLYAPALYAFFSQL